MKTIFIFTDCYDFAYNETKECILSNWNHSASPRIEMIPVHNFSLVNCSFLMRQLAESIAEPCIFYPLINPCEQEYERINGTLKSKPITFIGRNTGVFDWLTSDFGLGVVRSYKDIPFVPFGGRSVYPLLISDLALDSLFAQE